MPGIVSGAPRILLRLEALLVAMAALVFYAKMEMSWWLFVALFLVPDLSMAGYIAGRKTGAAVYNMAHWSGLPIAFITWGFYRASSEFVAVGLIWAAHIGLDRALGYGLKYSGGFGVSHLGLIGKAQRQP